VFLLGLLVKLWLIYGVELGKDEAAYWYWGQHLDATYALLPFGALKMAHALYPGSETVLRLVFVLSGAAATLLLYRLCRLYSLEKNESLWATAAFATSHWGWHISSYLHPDGFVVSCWLVALYGARRSIDRPASRLYILTGIAAGLAVLCKYSCAFLAGGLFLWLLLTVPVGRRWRTLLWVVVPFFVVVSPLAYAQLSTAFYLPHTLSTLSRVVEAQPLVWRLVFFLSNPLFFVSPLLLWLLYRALVQGLRRWHLGTDEAQLLALLPALALIGAFAFFALYRGQVKGNWILPAFLGLWPLAFQRANLPRYRRAYLGGLIGLGLVWALGIGLSLKYPGATGRLSDAVLGGRFDASYKALVSTPDQAREPSYSWTERLCEYHGWGALSSAVDDSLKVWGIGADVPVLSTQYGTVFALAYYQPGTRSFYTVDDPRFLFLSDFAERTGRVSDEVVFIVRQGASVPNSLKDYAKRRHLAGVPRLGGDCEPVVFELYLLAR